MLSKCFVCNIKVSEDAAADPSKRLEVTETELQLMLEVDASQTRNERPVEENCQLEEGRESEGETRQVQPLGKKNGKGGQFNTY